MSSHEPQPQSTRGRLTTVFLAGVISVAAIGYLVGINAGVPQREPLPIPEDHEDTNFEGELVIPAQSYEAMRERRRATPRVARVSLQELPRAEFDLFREITPDPEEKQESLRARSDTRAFNGAPPVIPHPVKDTNDAACYACHGQGLVVENLVARRMSHEYLANCTQCHAPPAPPALADAAVPIENSFEGVSAPLAGQRAYAGAPPTIPHSTWMRSQCLSCHGGAAGWAGMETTHPWRTACLQCHAPSAALDQALATEVQFLSSPGSNNP